MAVTRQIIARKTCVAAVMAACAGSAFAYEFETDGGWRAYANTTLSVSSAWRAQAPDKQLIMGKNAAAAGVVRGFVPSAGFPSAAEQTAGSAAAFAAGFRGGSPTDDANLNYDRGDQYSEIYKAFVEAAISKGDTGALIRFKAWYDNALNNDNVRWGNQASGFAANKPLSDSGFERLNRFDGTAILDAYVYSSFDVEDHPLQVRLGRQAMNWGESVFIQGINQISPLDITALRRAGTEIKEALLPIWSISANMGFDNGISADAFYQFKWENSNIEGCGTYWAPVGVGLGKNIGRCNMGTSTGFSSLSNRWAFLGPDGLVGGTGGPGVNSIAAINGPEPRDGGQFGVAVHFPVEAIDTEIGVYAMNIHSRTPILSGKVAGKAVSNPLASGPSMVAFWEYPEDLKIYGVSAATTISGWSVSGELSYQPNVPVQINANDMLIAGIFGGTTNALALSLGFDFTKPGTAGPVGDRAAAARASIAPSTTAANGAIVHGFDRFNKTQLQVNAVNILPALAGASDGLLVAEAGFQWNDVPNNNDTNIRYGRSFIFGFASHNTFSELNRLSKTLLGDTNATGNNCANTSLRGVLANPQPTGCTNDGFVSNFAWGYRVRASLNYNNVFDTSWQLIPSVFWSHDVRGYSLDTQFNEGRQALALGLRASLNKAHVIDLTYTTFNDAADFDANRDRDNVSVSYSYTF